MKAVLVSRYPRVDTPEWKRRLATSLEQEGFELGVLYSRSSVIDQAAAGLEEFGPSILTRYVALRAGKGRAEASEAASSQSLADWAADRDLPVVRASRLGDAATLEALRDLAPDLLILTGSDLVPAAVLEIPQVGTINAHYGLLPAYRGMNVTEWSVFHGDPIGVTVHLVDPGIDTGDILEREEIPIEAGDTWETLRAKHQDLAQRLLARAAVKLRDGTETRRPQDPADGRQYYRMHPAVKALAERRLAETVS